MEYRKRKEETELRERIRKGGKKDQKIKRRRESKGGRKKG